MGQYTSEMTASRRLLGGKPRGRLKKELYSNMSRYPGSIEPPMRRLMMKKTKKRPKNTSGIKEGEQGGLFDSMGTLRKTEKKNIGIKEIQRRNRKLKK